MSTFAEIVQAAERLPESKKQELIAHLAKKTPPPKKVGPKKWQGLKADKYPPLEGLPADLSSNKKKYLEEIISARNAANR